MSDTATLPIRPRRRLPAGPVLVLAAVVVAAAGFVGGVLVQKHAGGGGRPSPVAGTSSSAGEPRNGATGFRGFRGGSPPVAGQVKTVDGHRLYVDRSDGTTVEVRVKPGATVTRTAKSSVGAVHPGDTIVVQGRTAHDGTVRATSVSATASGAIAGGLPGFGAFGRGPRRQRGG